MSTYVCLEAEETEALSWGTYQLRPGTTLALCFYLVVGSSRSYGRVLYTVFSISTCSKPRNCIQKGAWTILQADFLNKIFTPLATFLFCQGKWHSGSLRMPNNPLWANASQASQLALEDIFLESHGPGFGEASWWVWVPETFFTEKPVACATLEVKTERQGHWCEGCSYREVISCCFSFSSLQNPVVIMTKNPHTEKSCGKHF